MFATYFVQDCSCSQTRIIAANIAGSIISKLLGNNLYKLEMVVAHGSILGVCRTRHFGGLISNHLF